MKIHPSDEVLEELLLSLSEERQEILFHTCSCPWCRSRLYYLPRSPEETQIVVPPPRSAPDYEFALDAGLEAVREREHALGKERAEAPDLFVELLEQPAGERKALLEGSPRLRTWGLFELLVERSLEVASQDPSQAEELGLLALEVSQHLELDAHGALALADLQGRAWAHVGNARRLRLDFVAAEEAFRHAAARLAEGTGDDLEKGILLDLEASLRRDQRRFEDAFRLLRRAVKLFLGMRDRHRAGRSLLKMATVHHHSGRPEDGIPLLFQALDLIDPEQEPRLLLCAHHNLIDYLAGSGRFPEARERYRAARPLYRSFPDAWTQNRRAWVKAKIAHGLGHLRRAESLFREARNGFLAEDAAYDTALVSLELATLYAGQGRTAELKSLAEEMLPVFASGKIHREALAALAFFRQAVDAEQAGLEVVTRMADYLRRARHDPELSFVGE